MGCYRKPTMITNQLPSLGCTVWCLLVSVLSNGPTLSDGFVPPVPDQTQLAFVSHTRLASSVGGGPPSSNDGRKSNSGGWEDFFPSEESENMLRAREYLHENSLPISFDNSPDDLTNGKTASSHDDDDADDLGQLQNGSAALSRGNVQPEKLVGSTIHEDLLISNPYFLAVSKITPSDLITKFTSTAHPRVQNAVRSTILSLIGGLPKMAFDTTTITTGQRLASLMFQLQMTGYLFKNAEYRLSLQQSLGSIHDIMDGKQFLLQGSPTDFDEDAVPVSSKIRGKIRVRYDSNKKGANHDGNESSATTQTADDSTSVEMEVDAAAYMSELTSEVQQLRDELILARKEKEDALRKDLLIYIQTLPKRELTSLTATISQDVLVAMKGLVNAVISGIGDGQIGPETVTEQSGEAMAQLCMWQLVIGYNLRTLEVREEMKKSLVESSSNSNMGPTSKNSSMDDLPPGAFE